MAEEKGKVQAWRKSRQKAVGGEEEWGSEEVPERRERRVEKRGAVAH